MEERLIECLKIAMEFHVTDIHFHLKTYPKESLSIEMKIEQDVRQMVPKEDDIRLFRYLMSTTHKQEDLRWKLTGNQYLYALH